MYQPATVYLAWAPASGGNIPRNAVVGGRDNTTREDLYIGMTIVLFCNSEFMFFMFSQCVI